MPQPHDRFYRELFSNPLAVQHLLEGFVHQPWVKQVDFSQIQLLKDIHVFEGTRRDSDVVWKLNVGESSVFVVLMLEFQSSMDRLMPLRMAHYQCLLYEQFFKEDSRGLLPQILPMVIYNGDDVWTAKQSLSELIDHAIPELEPFQLQSQYWLFEMNKIAEQPMPVQNLVASVVAMETSRSPDAFRDFLHDLPNVLKQPEYQHIKRLLYKTVQTLLARQTKLATITLIDTQPLQEAETMLETNILKWKQDLIYQGYADGEAKGKAEGKAEGEAKGKAEGWKTAQKTIAKTMKGLNLPLATIAVATGLTEAEIQDL